MYYISKLVLSSLNSYLAESEIANKGEWDALSGSEGGQIYQQYFWKDSTIEGKSLFYHYYHHRYQYYCYYYYYYYYLSVRENKAWHFMWFVC